MIGNWHDDETENLFKGGKFHRSGQTFMRMPRRKLLMIEAAKTLDDLRNPPGNKLEALERERKGQHSIRVNDQYRVCFQWRDGKAYDIEITDYH